MAKILKGYYDLDWRSFKMFTFWDAITIMTIYASWLDSQGRRTGIGAHFDAQKC